MCVCVREVEASPFRCSCLASELCSFRLDRDVGYVVVQVPVGIYRGTVPVPGTLEGV